MGAAHLRFLFLLFPPVFRQMNDIWHTNHPKVKKKAHVSLSICALLSLFFFYLFLQLPILLWSFLGYHPPQSPFSHFPFLFLLFRASLSLSLSKIFIQISYLCSIEDLKIEGVFKIHKSLNSSS